MKDAPPVMRNDEEAVENAKGQRRNCEEIHRGDSFTMIAQKSRPSFSRLRTSRCFPHPAQDGSLRNIETQHLQFTVDARCAPGRVLGDHAEDQFA
jgi:hypothetical protein